MSTIASDTLSNKNQSNSEVTSSLLIETNPSTMEPPNKIELSNTTSTSDTNNSNKSADKSIDITLQKKEEPSKKESKEVENNISADNNSKNNESVQNVEGENDDSPEAKGDSFTSFSTAFTISFGDESSATKKLSIKDSIRKFAPPKPHTIEKPRQSKSDQSQNHSLISVESAPATLSKHSPRKGRSNSSRSSSRKSNSSNVSETVAFLIDKMIYQPAPEDSPAVNESSVKHQQKQRISPKKIVQSKKAANSNDDILDIEIDYYEDRSDNGTYIVGADPESEAARRNIDVLFGVVKAAEASVIAESASRSQNYRSSPRKSRLTEKKPFDKTRQEHINRLAYRNSSMSRSSSSSRPETVDHQREPRTLSRRSQNSSCDRKSRVGGEHTTSKHRRSISQSSRQSCNNNKEQSDGDTRSSRSSLLIDADERKSPNSTNPSMKFNRAFDLRRARHALNDSNRMGVSAVPTAIPQPPAPTTHHFNAYNNHELDSYSKGNNISSSQRRHQINSNTYKANQSASSTGSTNFCRDDGGRFSLRMNNVALPTRLSAANQYQSSLKSPHHNTLLDSYISKAASAKYSSALPTSSHLCELQSRNMQTKQSVTSTTLPYQSSDELETSIPSPSNRYGRLSSHKGTRIQSNKKCHSELDGDSYQSNRFNYSLGAESCEVSNYQNNLSDRACSSASKHIPGNIIQPGALDSLVISAISSLSLKIRSSVCDVLVEQAKKLPVENETRSIVEEILPELQAETSSSKSPTSIEEIDQSLYFDLAKTLKNLKKVEQMVEVITLISNQLPPITTSKHSNSNSGNSSNFRANNQSTSGISRPIDSASNNSNITSMND